LSDMMVSVFETNLSSGCFGRFLGDRLSGLPEECFELLALIGLIGKIFRISTRQYTENFCMVYNVGWTYGNFPDTRCSSSSKSEAETRITR
jgi:hypothetical protein